MSKGNNEKYNNERAYINAEGVLMSYAIWRTQQKN